MSADDSRTQAMLKETEIDGEIEVNIGSSHFQYCNDLKRVSSKDSVSSIANKSSENMLLECPVCSVELPVEVFPVIQSCDHRICYDCLQQFMRTEISESRANITCPVCSKPFHPSDIRINLNDNILFEKYGYFMVRQVVAADPDGRWCSAPDCNFAVIASNCTSCPQIKCERPGCDSYFCYLCRDQWHPNQTCDEAWEQRLQQHEQNASQYEDAKPCPTCQAFISRTIGCNHMICCICKAEFCWACLSLVAGHYSTNHYNNESRCSVLEAAKEPMSRSVITNQRTRQSLWTKLITILWYTIISFLVAASFIPAALYFAIKPYLISFVQKRFMCCKAENNIYRKSVLFAEGVIVAILISPVLIVLEGVMIVLLIIFILIAIINGHFGILGKIGFLCVLLGSMGFIVFLILLN